MTSRGPNAVHLPHEFPRRVWRSDDLYVDVLPAADLGNSSFVVGDRNSREAIVIDATRDVSRYLDVLERSKVSLRWALDTHLHADFISGGKQLADLAGGRFGISADIDASFGHERLAERQRIELGSGHLTVLKSPGHTPEHISFLLHDSSGAARVLFSGGSLMAGTAARPDLLGPRYTNSLVRAEYVTLHETYAPLAGTVGVLPTHAGGSFCGVGTRSDQMTSLGRERRTNPLLQAHGPVEFFTRYLSGLPYPTYYGEPRAANVEGGRPIGPGIPDLPPIAPEELERMRRQAEVTVLDVRPSAQFETGHIPGSLSIPADGPVSAWVGWLRPSSVSLVLVDSGPETRRVVQVALLRIGFDGLRGYLAGGVEAYRTAGFAPMATHRVTMANLRRTMETGAALTVLDVRNPAEAAGAHVPGSVNIPLPWLERDASGILDRSAPVFVHCQSGYRAGIAASILERLGFAPVLRVTDGPERWAPRRKQARRPRAH